MPAFEIMMATPAIRTLIRDAKMHQALSVIESSRKHGMNTMDFSIKELFESGLITYEEAVRFVRQPGILNKERD